MSVKSARPPRSRRILVVVPNFPSRVQTFIAQELLSLERMGYSLEIHTLRAYGNDPVSGSVAAEISAPIRHPAGNLISRLRSIGRAYLFAHRLKGYPLARRAMLADLRATWSITPILNFVSAMMLSEHVNPETDVLYAQFLKSPASVTYYTSLMTGVPWACSAHARDIWLGSNRDLKNKIDSASWVATCTTYGAERLRKLAANPERIYPIYHGVNSQLFSPSSRKPGGPDGSNGSEQVKLLTVGRIVSKKGFPNLIKALSLLPTTLNWSLRHIGPERGAAALKQQAERLGISAHIEFAGYRSPHELVHEYRRADVFILPCLIDRDGDMDGLPNALAEAASQALACITTKVSEIPRLFEDGKHALLVAPGDPQELAHAIQRLITAPQLRRELGEAASSMIAKEFDHHQHIQRLSGLFQALT